MLRVIGWLGWLGIVGLVASLLAAVFPGLSLPVRSDVFLFSAFLAAFLPLLVMIVDLNTDRGLAREDKRAWRALLPWGGPITACYYFTCSDRQISRKEGVKWLLELLG